MIRVLQDWREIGECFLALQRAGLPAHETVQKNWDHFLLAQLVEPIPRDVRVADLGCGAGYTMSFLSALGFTDICGVELHLGWRLHLRRGLDMRRRRRWRVPYRFRRADLTHTPFAAGSVHIATCISTIEHGVPIDRFLAEAARILCPGGLLFVTTDYWEQKIETDAAAREFGLPWRVFGRDEIAGVVDVAARCGLQLVRPGPVPPCGERTVLWNGERYTFIALAFARAPGSRSPAPPLLC